MQETTINFNSTKDILAWVKTQRKVSFHVSTHARNARAPHSLIQVTKPALLRYLDYNSYRDDTVKHEANVCPPTVTGFDILDKAAKTRVYIYSTYTHPLDQ